MGTPRLAVRAIHGETMEPFEYVMVLVSIIIGLAIAHILSAELREIGILGSW